MTVKKDKIQSYCAYCGSPIKEELLKEAKESSNRIICEYCGLRIYPQKYFDSNNEKSNHFNKKSKTKRKKYGDLTKEELNQISIDVFLEDKDFSLHFKQNLCLVLSRVIHYMILNSPPHFQVNEKKIRFLGWPICKDLVNNLEFVSHKRLNHGFLKNLHKLSIEQFELPFKLLQEKLQTDSIYRYSFVYFLEWLIYIIFELIMLKQQGGKQKLPELKKRLLKDMKEFEYVKVPFEDVKKRAQNTMKLNNNIDQTKKENVLLENKIKRFPFNIFERIKGKNDYLYKFCKKVKENIEKFTDSIECTDKQKEFIILKSKEILNKLMSKAEREEITIPMNAKPNKHSAAIIYAVLVSNDYMPHLSGLDLAKLLLGKSTSCVSKYYNIWYKKIAPRLHFDFRHAQLGRSREFISLYIFEQLLDKSIDTSVLIARLRNIITSKKHPLIKAIGKGPIRAYCEMNNFYPKTFTKFFSDLVKIVKLLIISIESHKIIGADFSSLAFINYLVSKKINLYLKKRSLKRVIGRIFKFLKNSKYKYLFPPQMQSEKDVLLDGRRIIIGLRIKDYVMKHIYNGKYLLNGIAVCPECLKEGFRINIKSPRITSKEFHHKNARLEGYTSAEFYSLFASDRGNPYFLQDLIHKMESESVVLLCRAHHRLKHVPHFISFKKLICWEEIPIEFPQKIFELSPEIIHMLAILCVDNYYETKSKKLNKRIQIKNGIINKLKKKYLIDYFCNGLCPCCGEFNSKDHLPVFDFNHLEESSEDSDYVSRSFYLPTSKLANKMEIEEGGYLCCNCHTLIHEDIGKTDLVYEDEKISQIIIKDKNSILEKNKKNLIQNTKSIENILKPSFRIQRSHIKFLFSIYEASKQKNLVTTGDLSKYYNNSVSYSARFFKRRKIFLENYGKINWGKGSSQTEYYFNKKGKKVVELMIYFKDYYQNLKEDYSIL
ncbi:MAG: hypothetical protein BAJALOKI2v1_1020007 [Promethearchaeota archaeon]|nr:MAG: hypothetical protein BAJALOKI2v1_1020007 [Candidatus Lokiarchaeota archaeon]